MLRRVFGQGDWFAPKRFGYGASLPIAWQGWALMLAYIGVMIGLGLALKDAPRAIAGAMVLMTILFALIAARHTRGGWRWRRGSED